MLGFTLTVDPKDSTRYALCFAVPSASLTKETYVTNSGKQKNAYLNYLTELLKISKVPAEEAFSRAQSFYELERELSKNSLNAEEYGDIDKVYNLLPFRPAKNLPRY